MNTIVITDEIAAFVSAVRTHLSDLDVEEQRDILDGLEADLGELVAEQGLDALGDPAAYASELRTAAGIGAHQAPRSRRRPGERVNAALDAVRERWDAVVTQVPGDATGLLLAVQPVWWVLRAWIAVQLVALLSGDTYLTVVPDESLVGSAGLVVAALLSVQLGRGRLWPGERVHSAAGLRLGMVAFNMLAVAALPLIAGNIGSLDGGDVEQAYELGISDGERTFQPGGPTEGVFLGDRSVTNIYPYDAQGSPLVGVQLFDQTGRPLEVTGSTECVYDEYGMVTDQYRVYYPWSDGFEGRANVFPVPTRVQPYDPAGAPEPKAFAGKDRPAVRGFPFVSVPGIKLPGLLTSTSTTPAKAFVRGPAYEEGNPVEYGC